MIKVILLSIITVFSTVNLSAAEKVHEHHHDQSIASKPVEKPAQRFVADSDLQKGMSQILLIMKGLHKAKDNSALKIVADKLDLTVANIFKTCKMEPKSDAALHPVLADITEGAALFKKGRKEEGHEKIHQALLRYEEFFEHPGWDHKE